jgi:hypothetical protein
VKEYNLAWWKQASPLRYLIVSHSVSLKQGTRVMRQTKPWGRINLASIRRK